MSRLVTSSVLCAAVASCGPPQAWPVPTAWLAEEFPFPLEFAPSLPHKGVEELRFAPGMFDPNTLGYWTYAFVWRLDDAAQLTPVQLGDELTAYFRGLLIAVDGDKHRIPDPSIIAASVEPGNVGSDDQFVIKAHIVDAFTTGKPMDLIGYADRHTCHNGSLWVFGFAPGDLSLQRVRQVTAAAECDQPIVPNKKR
jgi:hypothetical protein